jgi:hypothetical protein
MRGDKEDMRALAKRLEALKRRTSMTSAFGFSSSSPPPSPSAALPANEDTERRRRGEEKERQNGQFATTESWKRREGEVLMTTTTTTTTMSPVKKISTTTTKRRDIGEVGAVEYSARSPPRQKIERLTSPNLGKARRINIPVEVEKRNGAKDPRRRAEREFQTSFQTIEADEERKYTNSSTSSSQDIDNFLHYVKETRQRKDAEFAIASAVESARSKIFMEVTNFLNEEMLPEDADVVSVTICQKFAELAIRNQRLVRSASEAREIIDKLSAELNSFRDSCEQ